MFRFKRRTTQSLDYIERLLVSTRSELDQTNRLVRIVMGNQEVFDSYAEKIAEQNSQIKAAVAVIVSELGKLQSTVGKPLETAKMDAAIAQLTAAVDEVEQIDPIPDEPVVSDDLVVVEEPVVEVVEEPVAVEEEPVEDAPVEE